MKKYISLIVILCITICLYACSNGNNVSDSGSSSSEKSTEAPSQDEGKSKTWVIAMDTDYRPFVFKNEKNEYVGMDVELIKEIAKNQGVEIELRMIGWEASMQAVQDKEADAMFGGVSITEERKSKGWIYSDSYYNGCQVIAVADDSGIEYFEEDLPNKTVAVKKGTLGEDYAESLKERFNLTIKTFDTTPDAYGDVLLSNSDAIIEDKPVIQYVIKENGTGLRILPRSENEGTDYGLFIMDSENRELLDIFNAGLSELKENGTYDKIISKYIK